MSNLEDKDNLAVRVGMFLASKGYGCAITMTDDGAYVINYATNKGEGDMQPPIRVEGGKIIIPAGSDFDLVMSLLDF